MCLAIPGQVIKIDNEKLTVRYPDETRQALAGGLSLSINDFVLIQMGIAVKKLTKKEAAESWKAWKTLK